MKRQSTSGNMTVRQLIEHLAQYDGELEVMTRNYQHGSDRVSLYFMGPLECALDNVFIDGEDRQVVTLG